MQRQGSGIHGGRGRGQMIVLFALVLTSLLLVVGLVVDGGNALLQRRQAQNAADFAACPGLGSSPSMSPATRTTEPTRTSATRSSIRSPSTGGPRSPSARPMARATSTRRGRRRLRGWRRHPDGIGRGDGRRRSDVDAVLPRPRRHLGMAGVRGGDGKGGLPRWSASGRGVPGRHRRGVLRWTSTVRRRRHHARPAIRARRAHLTPGTLNVPGGFGWLKFGCTGYGLGQGEDGGCDNSKPFLQEEIGPPANSYRVLHGGRPPRQPRQDRQPARQQGQCRLQPTTSRTRSS